MFLRSKNGALIHIDEIKYLHKLKMYRTESHAYVAVTVRSNPNDPANPNVGRFELEMPDAKRMIDDGLFEETQRSDSGDAVVFTRPQEVEQPEGNPLQEN